MTYFYICHIQHFPVQETQEMAFQRVQFQNFSGQNAPPPPPTKKKKIGAYVTYGAKPGCLKLASVIQTGPAGLQIKTGQGRACS